MEWNGNLSPWVFVSYSPVNVRELFARGQSLAGLERFGRELAELSDPLWAKHVRRNGRPH